MDCSPPGSSVHGISQARILEWVTMSSSRDLPHPGIKPGSTCIAGMSPKSDTFLVPKAAPAKEALTGYPWPPSLVFFPSLTPAIGPEVAPDWVPANPGCGLVWKDELGQVDLPLGFWIGKHGKKQKVGRRRSWDWKAQPKAVEKSFGQGDWGSCNGPYSSWSLWGRRRQRLECSGRKQSNLSGTERGTCWEQPGQWRALWGQVLPLSSPAPPPVCVPG